MMTSVLRLAPSPATINDQGRSASRPLVHAENPDRPGFALCGKKLGSTPAAPTGRCVVCEDLTRPAYWMR